MSLISNEKIVVSLLLISIDSPLLAFSYNLSPFTFIAEYIGGFCWIAPINLFAVSRISVFEIFEISKILSTEFQGHKKAL